MDLAELPLPKNKMRQKLGKGAAKASCDRWLPAHLLGGTFNKGARGVQEMRTRGAIDAHFGTRAIFEQFLPMSKRSKVEQREARTDDAR